MKPASSGSILKNSDAKLLSTPMFLECKMDDADNPIRVNKPELLSDSKKKHVKFQIEPAND